MIEHIQNPEITFNEIWRLLKPGGKFISKTPNRRHYIPFFARITPHWFHDYYNKLRGRDSEDTFPTVYKCNSKKQLIKSVKNISFNINQIQMWEGRPEYLRLTAPTYFMGYLYERFVNSSEKLSGFRSVLVFELEKV